MLKKYRIKFVYLLVLFSEFPFFFVLPILGRYDDFSAKDVASVLAISVILESILLLALTGYLQRHSRKFILFISSLLRAVAFLLIFYAANLASWYGFFITLAVSKSLAKPLTREVLADSLEGDKLKRSMSYYSFFQNVSIVLAPICAGFAIKFNQVGGSLMALSLLSFLIAPLCFLFIYRKPFKQAGNESKTSTHSHLYTLINSARKIELWPLRYLLFSAFLTFFLMGIFITGTTLISRIRVEFAEYSVIFFSLVGFSICIWQGVLSRWVDLSERNTSILLFGLAGFSAAYLTGNLMFAVLALVAYSVFESIIVPLIYYKSTVIQSGISSGVIFSLIMVASNMGEAFGSFVTGSIIDSFAERAVMPISVLIFATAVLSVFFQNKVK